MDILMFVSDGMMLSDKLLFIHYYDLYMNMHFKNLWQVAIKTKMQKNDLNIMKKHKIHAHVHKAFECIVY